MGGWVWVGGVVVVVVDWSEGGGWGLGGVREGESPDLRLPAVMSRK